MAELHHVKRARKAIPEAGIEVGQPYYFYKRRVNGKGTPRVCSLTKPRRSAYATSSPFLGKLMDLEDDLGRLVVGGAPPEIVVSWLNDVVSEIESLGDDCRDKAASVEQGMKNGAGVTSAERLQARAYHCSDLAAAIREAASDLEAKVSTDTYWEVDINEVEPDPPSLTVVAEAVASIVWLP